MSHRNLPKILITAYAVNPYKGSEDGTAWNMLSQIARYNKVVAITRKNNQEAIEKYLDEHEIKGAENLSFAYFDLPYWMRFWKRGGRGALLYFYLWQIGLVFFILRQKFQYDIVHQLNFHNDWTPSFLWALKKPFVWGPIGHHPAIPKDYLLETSQSKFAYYFDQLKWWTKKTFWAFDPFLKITKKKAVKIITINSSVRKVLNFDKSKEVRLPAVATKPVMIDLSKQDSKTFNILSIGRFVSLKGFDMTIKSFAHFYHQQSKSDKQKLQLTLIGKGPMKDQLVRLAKKLQVGHAVKFIEWMSRSELDTYFKQSALFFFPSHEGAGMVVPEALSFGLPVLCYNNIGPGEFINENCGFKVDYSHPKESRLRFSKHLDTIFHQQDIQQKLSKGALRQFDKYFTWERKGRIISHIYLEILFPDVIKDLPEEVEKMEQHFQVV